MRLDGELKEVFVEQNINDVSNEKTSINHDIKEGHIVSNMPGRVIKINYSIGDKINKGDVVLIVEAMKMENEVIANVSGIIKEIYIDINSQIANNEPLMLVE